MFPKFLDPAYTEVFQLNNVAIEIPKCIVQFQNWTGPPVKESFGGKPVVSFNDKPMFAEMAIATLFMNSGWQARWTETYGRANKEPICIQDWSDENYWNQKHVPITDKRILEVISGMLKCNKGSYSGFWDVLAWTDDQLIFAEAMRNNKDSIRSTQNKWLQAGLAFGLKPENFLLVQWDFNPRCISG